MRKAIKFFIFLFIILAVAGAIGLHYIDSIIKTGINKYGPEVTQTTVQLDDLSTSVIHTHLELKGLTIGSPKGYSAPYMLKLGKVYVDVDRSTLTKDIIIINNIDISDVSVTYELAGRKSNLTALNENIAEFVNNKAHPPEQGQKETQKPKTAKDAPPGAERRVVIKKLTIKNADVSLATSIILTNKTASATIQLPDLLLENLGSGDQPMTLAQAVGYILHMISMNTIESLAKTTLRGVLYISDNVIQLSGKAIGAAMDVTVGTVKTISNVAQGAAGVAFSVVEGTTGVVTGAAKGTIGVVSDVGKGTVGVVTDVGKGTAGLVKDVGQGAAGAVKDVGKSLRGLFSSDDETAEPQPAK